MQVIILAAGRGKRLGILTEENPKSMVLIEGKPLLGHILENLPPEIDSIIIAINHQGEKIKNYFGSKFKGGPVTYFQAPELNGTAGTLFHAQPLLHSRFLVLYGDDLHSKEDLNNLIRYPVAMGVFKGKPNHLKYLQVETDKEGMLADFRPPTPDELEDGMKIVTGAFMLDKRIFDYEPVRMASGEYGLPQTILEFAKDNPVKTVPMQSWQTITYPEDIPNLHI